MPDPGTQRRLYRGPAGQPYRQISMTIPVRLYEMIGLIADHMLTSRSWVMRDLMTVGAAAALRRIERERDLARRAARAADRRAEQAQGLP